jgi:FkbM family methyltransferase
MKLVTAVKAYLPEPIIRLARRVLGRDRYDRLTGEVMRVHLRADSNAVDVGANKGDILAEILACAPSGTHMAFEPLPELADGLRKRFPGVDVRQVALSDEAGRVSFHRVIGHEAFSGFRRRPLPDESWKTTLIDVERERLAVLWPAERPLHFVKIDVEGAQLEVLRGAIPLLDRWKPIVVFEHGPGARKTYGTTSEDVYDLFAGCRMQLWLLEKWLARAPALDRAEFVRQVEERINYYFVAGPPFTQTTGIPRSG